MKTNAYKVTVKIKELNGLAGSSSKNDVIYDIQAHSAMDAHKQIHDKIDWRLQEVDRIEYVNNKTVVYTLEDGFLEDA